MSNIIEEVLSDRGSSEKALANLLAAYQRQPSRQSARAIQLIRTELKLRKRPAEPPEGGAVEDLADKGGAVMESRRQRNSAV